MLVWRWYYLDNTDLLMIGRSIYPQGRMVFRTELTRAPNRRQGTGSGMFARPFVLGDLNLTRQIIRDTLPPTDSNQPLDPRRLQ